MYRAREVDTENVSQNKFCEKSQKSQYLLKQYKISMSRTGWCWESRNRNRRWLGWATPEWSKRNSVGAFRQLQVTLYNRVKVYQNSFFEEITPVAVICSRGEPFYLGIMTHPHFRFLLSFLHRVSSSDLLQINSGPSLRVGIRLISLDRRKISTFLTGVIPGTFAVRFWNWAHYEIRARKGICQDRLSLTPLGKGVVT